MVLLFLVQVTLALGSEIVQTKVTVSSSTAKVFCGFSIITTAIMENRFYQQELLCLVFYFINLTLMDKTPDT